MRQSRYQRIQYVFKTMGWDVNVLKKITDTKGAENLFHEGMLRLVEMDIQVPQQHHIGLKVNEVKQVLKLADNLGWRQYVSLHSAEACRCREWWRSSYLLAR